MYIVPACDSLIHD